MVCQLIYKELTSALSDLLSLGTNYQVLNCALVEIPRQEAKPLEEIYFDHKNDKRQGMIQAYATG